MVMRHPCGSIPNGTRMYSILAPESSFWVGFPGLIPIVRLKAFHAHSEAAIIRPSPAPVERLSATPPVWLNWTNPQSREC